jgi:hypothetical protein
MQRVMKIRGTAAVFHAQTVVPVYEMGVVTSGCQTKKITVLCNVSNFSKSLLLAVKKNQNQRRMDIEYRFNL